MSQLQHLPPAAVAYLDALALPGGDARSLHPAFLELLGHVENWLTFQSGYSIDDEEQGHLDNIASLLEAVRTTVEESGWKEQLQPLVRDLYPLIALMDHVNRQREAAHYSPQPAVNELLLCGAAYLSGRADETALSLRLDRLEAYLDVLQKAYDGVRSQLHPEAAQALETGLDHLESGLEQLRQASSPEATQDGLATVAEAAQVVQFLIDWQAQREQKWREAHHRWCIPEVGADLQATLEAADDLDEVSLRQQACTLGPGLLETLQRAWQRVRTRVILEPETRVQFEEQIDNAIADLSEIWEALCDPAADQEQTLEELEDVCEQLSTGFQGLRKRSLPYQHLYGTEAGDYLEAVLGLMARTSPWARVQFLLESRPPAWPGVAAPLRQYALAPSQDLLAEAAFALVSSQPAPPVGPEMGEARWQCNYCGNHNPTGQRTCAGCQSSQGGGTAVAWAEA